jgi:hypothetical protein
VMWVKRNLVLVCLEIVLVLAQDSCAFCAKCTIGSESVWTPAMVLLDDEAQVEARFSPFGDSANLDARWMHGLRPMYRRLRNHFGCTGWKS